MTMSGNWIDVYWDGYENGNEIWLSFDRTTINVTELGILFESVADEDVLEIMNLWDGHVFRQ